jgi:hypothetical protein
MITTQRPDRVQGRRYRWGRSRLSSATPGGYLEILSGSRPVGAFSGPVFGRENPTEKVAAATKVGRRKAAAATKVGGPAGSRKGAKRVARGPPGRRPGPGPATEKGPPAPALPGPHWGSAGGLEAASEEVGRGPAGSPYPPPLPISPRRPFPIRGWPPRVYPEEIARPDRSHGKSQQVW